MNGENEKKISMDILKHLEDLSSGINRMMSARTRNAFRRYPVTFGLLILVGVIAVNEGIKGLFRQFGLLDINPWYLLIAGIIILIITGKLYKKLDK